MTLLQRRARRLALPALALALAACTPTIDNHGHQVDAELLSQITPGVTSREEVLHILGSPSTMSTFDDADWYYISQRTERMSFYQSAVTAQDVVTVSFDRTGLVTNVGKHGIEEAKAVDPAAEKTRTLGNEMTFLQQLLGNVGRFNTDQPEAGVRPQAPGGF